MINALTEWTKAECTAGEKAVRHAFAVTALCAVVSMAGVSAATAKQHQTDVPGEHYLCYNGEYSGTFKPVNVKLADQFMTWGTAVVRVERVCTPVSKNGSGIFDKRIHLVCYNIKPGKPAGRIVEMANQLGQQRFSVGKPTMLCVPSYKKVIK